MRQFLQRIWDADPRLKILHQSYRPQHRIGAMQEPRPENDGEEDGTEEEMPRDQAADVYQIIV